MNEFNDSNEEVQITFCWLYFSLMLFLQLQLPCNSNCIAFTHSDNSDGLYNV